MLKKKTINNTLGTIGMIYMYIELSYIHNETIPTNIHNYCLSWLYNMAVANETNQPVSYTESQADRVKAHTHTHNII